MSDDVKDFAYYASQAEEYLQLSMGYDLEGLRTLISDETMNRHIMRADVLARLACGAPKSSAFIDPEPCGSLHPIGDEDGHVVLNSPTWCRYIHGHAGNHQCMAGHEWENKS